MVGRTGDASPVSPAVVTPLVKVKGQGHQGQNTAFLALSAACMWFMFSKTSFVSSILKVYYKGYNVLVSLVNCEKI